MRIGFEADARAEAALARIGRTEDLAFSPDGRRLALPGYANERLLILDVEAPAKGGGAARLSGAVEIVSSALRAPHGCIWLDGETLAVANRAGGVAMFAVPEAAEAPVDAVPLHLIATPGIVATPGSLSAAPLGLGLVELLVCNNYAHRVSRHLLDARRRFTPVASEILLTEGLALPDGVAHAPGGGWIAVSNHDRHCIFLYRNRAGLDPEIPPDGVLRGPAYPHGLAFGPDGRTLLVADAGAPCVHLFRSADGGWAGERESEARIEVLGLRAFARGHHNAQEGGPKGIALGPGGLLAATCEEQALALFDVAPSLTAAQAPAPEPAETADARARALMLRCLEGGERRLDQAAAAMRESAARELATLLTSRSWRATAPLRRAAGGLRRAAEPWRRWRRARAAGTREGGEPAPAAAE